MFHFSTQSLKGWIWIGQPRKLAEPELVSILTCPIQFYNAKKFYVKFIAPIKCEQAHGTSNSRITNRCGCCPVLSQVWY